VGSRVTTVPSARLPWRSARWIACGTVLLLAVAAVNVAETPGDPSRVSRVGMDTAHLPAADAPRAEAVRFLELHLERLTQRVGREPVADLFDARPWDALAAEEGRRNAPPPLPPLPPQAPPLPFGFMGKLIEGEEVTVFLTNGARNWVVRAGDTIDGVYRVDDIGDERMTLTYLALQLPQELTIGEKTMRPEPRGTASAVEALPAAPRASALLPGQVPLLFAAPSRATVGTELIVRLALPAGSVARQARIELAYDPAALTAAGVPTPDAGRMVVELGAAAPLAQVRFRVIAQSPTSARIGIVRAVATDAGGRHLSLAAPDAHSVQIVAADS
jgi:hypothetical protein